MLVNIEWRDYLREDLQFMMEHPKSGVWWEPRLGKTVVGTLAFYNDDKCRRLIIICSKNAMLSWHDHMLNLLPRDLEGGASIHYVRGSEYEREQIWQTKSLAAKQVFIVTAASFLRDYEKLIRLRIRFDSGYCDEPHKYLKNHKSKTFKAVAEYFKDMHRIHMFTGTPTEKLGPLDYYTSFYLFDRKKFRSYWAFAERYMEIVDGVFGKEIIGPRNLEEFRRLRDSYGRVRRREECAPQMPKIQRALLKIGMSKEQEKIHSQLGEESYVWSGDNLIVASTSMETVLRKRQLLCSPRILDKSLGVGAAIEDLAERLEDAVDVMDRHVVIFVPFRLALDIFSGYLQSRGHTTYMLHGGLEPEVLAERIADYKRTQGIMLCTIPYAQAFSLVPAQVCYFIGYEWSPSANKQAEDRLIPQHGIEPIQAWYYAHEGSIDDAVAERVNIKQKLASLTQLRSSEPPLVK